MRAITVATVQMQPELGKTEDNLLKMSDFITRIASEQPVDLIIFPELVMTGYEVGPRFPELAQPFTVAELGGWAEAYTQYVELLWQSQIEPRLDLESAPGLLTGGE